ncbi:MAG: YqgE/AlgH family protein [Ignavibacteria bacterium]|nr:YqgE/AlgH family protein [Ignavibacteria bacterium]
MTLKDQQILNAEKGNLLISAPHLSDIFNHTVIFLTEHNEQGSIGFILNRESELKLNEVVEDFPEFDARVFIGGPVENNLLNFIHKAGNLLEGGYEIVDGVYWGGNYENLKLMAETKILNPDDFLFFLGYSGWGPNQLNNELKEKAWFVNNFSQDYLFTDNPSNLWHKILKDMGGDFTIISTFPENPSDN